MSVQQKIVPSKMARNIFSLMVARSDKNGYLDIDSSLVLASDLIDAGIQHNDEIKELRNEGWIEAASKGGWRVG